MEKANKERLERLLKRAGLPIDLNKIVGSTILVDYINELDKEAKTKHKISHLLSEVTGLIVPNGTYDFLQMELTCREILGWRIESLEFKRNAPGEPQRWFLYVKKSEIGYCFEVVNLEFLDG